MKTNKILPLLFFLLPSSYCTSQSIQKEINDQVWRVQLEAMKTNQADKFISVMSDDVVQISYTRQAIRNKEQFLSQAIAIYHRLIERKLTRTMEFRFLNRIAGNTNAFEDGFFKYELLNEKNESQVFYGYFQVVLKKEKDIWRVLVDYDAETYNGAPVTKELFGNAKSMESFDN